VTTIARPVVKEVEEKKAVEIKKDKTKQILEILAMPSHQIPNLDDVSINVFDVLLEKRVDERPEDILVHMDEMDLVDDVAAVPLSMQDIAKLRHMFLE
jgi:Cdc6-like AAA superfamily ATPase